MSLRKLALFSLIILAIAAFWWFDLNQWLSFETIKQHQQALLDHVDQRPLLAALLFFIIYIVATALSIPGAALLTLLAGALFGVAQGVLIVSFASTIGASLAFVAARYLFRSSIETRYASKLHKINQGINQDGAFYLFSLRLIPIFPFFLINLVMALSQLRLKTFYWVSQVGMLPATIVYVNAGTELAKLNSLSGILSPSLIIAFSLLALLPYFSKAFINRLKRQRVYAGFSKPKRFDNNLIVIGAGAGGLVSAYIAATVKAKVSLIEKHRMGGDCLNTGCVPSKALIRCAKFAYQAKQAERFGYQASAQLPDFGEVMARVKQVIAEIEPHDSVERYQQLGVECIQGEAYIHSPWEIEVNGQRITSQNIVIATGARPAVPPIPGLTEIDYLTSDTLWQLEQRPEQLLVLGGGPIGCELAQAFSRLGSDVTQVELAEQLMGREDTDVADFAASTLKESGVNVLTSHKALRFERHGDEKVLVVQHNGVEHALVYDDVIIAVGRKARLSGFGLEELGIVTDRKVDTNDYLQTLFPNILAAGDVAGPYQFTHTASHEAYYAAVNALFGDIKRSKADYRTIPFAIFTDPEIARVGLSESEAQTKGVAYEVTRYDLDDLDRAIADGATKGFVKVLTAKGSDRILGATIIGAEAGNLLAEFTLAMKHGLGLNKILGTIHIYPTLAEANKYVAGNWRKARVNPRALSLLQRFHAWRLGK